MLEILKGLPKRTNKPEHFIVLYGELFQEYREKPIRLLEIGVQDGDSIELWKKYFKKAEIVGLDVRPIAIEGATIVAGDQSDPEILRSLGNFDIIIDDGGHKMSQQKTSFNILFDQLNEGGIYVIEDLETSYLVDYKDSLPTTVDFLKGLVDSVNKKGKNNNIKSMHFIKDLAVIKKK